MTQVPLPRGLKKLHLVGFSFLNYGTKKKLDIDEEVIAPIKKHLKGGGKPHEAFHYSNHGQLYCINTNTILQIVISQKNWGSYR